jgi:Fe-only nitrogenase accessory protein AnfO
MRIAAYVDEGGYAVGLYEPGSVLLYEKAAGAWRAIREVPLSLSVGMPLAEVRTRIHEAVARLEGCKVFIAAEVKGLSYTIFEGLGFAIWKVSGLAENRLEYLRLREEEELLAVQRRPPSPQPVGDEREGSYRIDLAEILNSDSRFSSKEILIPFLEKAVFQRLEILCDHPPRWLGQEFERLRLKYQVEALDPSGHEMRILVRPA